MGKVNSLDRLLERISEVVRPHLFCQLIAWLVLLLAIIGSCVTEMGVR